MKRDPCDRFIGRMGPIRPMIRPQQSGESARFACNHFFGAAHFTALIIILRTFLSKKIGLVSWPGWK